MTLATLKMKGLDWDDVKIAVGGDHPAIVVLKDRTSVADLNTTLLHALFDNEDAPLTLTIDGNVHTLEAPVWIELLDKTAEWMSEYLPAMDPDCACPKGRRVGLSGWECQACKLFTDYRNSGRRRTGDSLWRYGRCRAWVFVV